MRKLLSLPTIIAATTIIILVGAVVYLSGSVDELGTNLEKTQLKLQESEAEVIELTKEIDLLQDSISTLNTRIEDLDKTLKERNILIKELNGKIKRRNKLIKDLKVEIASLYEKGNVDSQKIKELQAEIETIGGQLMEIQEEKEKLKNAVPQLEKKKEKIQKKTDDNTRWNDIMTNTTVAFNKVVLKKKKTKGADISSIKQKDKNWKFTQINFNIDHPNSELIIGKEFRLKIKDLDNDKTLPINERNNKFPDSNVGKAGEKFVYNGAPIEVNYFNSQVKEGMNYEIQVFFLENGKAFLLKNSKLRIIENGKVLSP